MDNSTKHTPSPWAARVWKITGPVAAADYVATEAVKAALPEVFVRTVGQADGVGKAAVCTVYGMSAEEVEANARLLAAAPDLLSALVSMNHMGGDERGGYCICPLNDGSAPEHKHSTSCAGARAAIAKATGGAA